MIPKQFLKRKKLLINQRIQGLILRKCAAFWLIYHVLMLHTLFGFEFMKYQVDIMNGGNVIPFFDLYGAFLVKYAPLLITALAMLPVVAFDVLKMSHRIVGPLVPFQRAVKQLKNGEHVEKVNIRKEDLLIEFQQDFNEFLTWYNQQNNHPFPESTATAGADEQEVLDQVNTLRAAISPATPNAHADTEAAEEPSDPQTQA